MNEILNKKEVLKKLNNQYFKSFARFEHVYYYMSNFDEKVKKFNNEFLKLTSAVLTGDVDKTLERMCHTSFYFYATSNERENLEFEISRKWKD